MVQAAVLDGLQFDVSPFGQNGFATAKMDVGRGEVADAPVGAVVVVGGDEGGNGCFKFAFEEGAFEQTASLSHSVEGMEIWMLRSSTN